MRIMKKLTLIASCVALLLSSCAHEYNQVLKSGDYTYKYEYAKQSYAQGKYSRAIPLLQELVTMKKGSTEGEECLYMLAMAEYGMKDYETAAEYFKKYYSSYPKGKFAENAKYFVGESLYQNAPEPRLDQSTTITAIGGNNYEACIVTAQNALKDYPYSNRREEFASLIMKGKYELAKMSVEKKQLERYQDAEDECYGFINEYPDSKDRALAEKYIEKCKQYEKEHPETALDQLGNNAN